MREDRSRRRHCDRHRDRTASHFCEACDADRCVRCVFEDEGYRGDAGGDFEARCCKCGSFAKPLRSHRSETQGYFARILAAPLFPLSYSGALMLLATAVATYFLPFFLCVGGILAQAILWAIFFGLLRQTALGSKQPEVPDFSSLWSDLLVPLGRGIAATALLWVPAALYLYWRVTSLVGVELDEDSLQRILFLDPVLWLIMLAGIVYMPMALIIAGLGGNVLQMLNPVRIGAFALRVPRDYLIAVTATVVLVIVWAVPMAFIAEALTDMRLPIVPGLIGEVLTLYPLFVIARVLGLLAFVHGDSFSFGSYEEFLETAVEDPRPLGRPSPAAQRQSVPLSPEPVAADPVAVAPGFFHAAAASLPSVSSFTAESALDTSPSPDEAILAALELRDSLGAIALYRDASSLGPHAVRPPTHLEVGRAAAGAGDMELARSAFEAAATIDPDHEEVPRAMVLLARVYRQSLGDPGRADAIFHEVVRRFPGTPAADFSLKQLEAES